MAMFHDRVVAAQKKKQLGQCKCWDCVRAVGLTPPYQLRNKHPRMYPYQVFNHNEGTPAGDPGGVPTALAPQPSKHRHGKASDKRHLRSAIRNREVQ